MDTPSPEAPAFAGYRVRVETTDGDESDCIAFIEEWPHFALSGSSVLDVLEQLDAAMADWAGAQRAAGQTVPPPARLDRASVAPPATDERPSDPPHKDRSATRYGGEDPSVELGLSAEEIAVVDVTGRRRACEAPLSADRRSELASALARVAEAAQRSEYSDGPTKLEVAGGGRIDVAALPRAVAVYVFPPGAWRSRSVRLTPEAARRLAADLLNGGPSLAVRG